jgi:isopenicillin N synthase-like dioxygenase
MAYAKARVIDVAEIPVIDAGGLLDDSGDGLIRVAEEMLQAAQNTGFFYIKNHGVPQELIDRVFAASAKLFSYTDAQKQQIAVTDRHRGFLKIGEAKMQGQKRVDLKESYIWGLDVDADGGDFDPPIDPNDPLLGPNRWPDFMPELQPVLNEYFDATNACGKRLLRAFAASLGVDDARFIGTFNRPVSRGSLIYYPPQPADMDEDQFGVAPHTDYGCLTLLAQDQTGGLQVKGKGGEWLTAHPIPGTYVVNVGDLLARWTNNRFVSTPHRVINSGGKERYSIAVFVDPDATTLIEPVTTGDAAQFDPVSVGEYVLGRFDNSFAYRKEV